MKKRFFLVSLITILVFSTLCCNYNIVEANNEKETNILSNDQKVLSEELTQKPSEGFNIIEDDISSTGISNKSQLFASKRKTTVKGITSNGLSWEILNGILTISGTGEIEDFAYTADLSQLAPWYNDKDKITKVVIEEGVTKIGRGAFFDCRNLTEVVAPTTLTTVADYAFQDTGLTEFKIPNNLTTLSLTAFYGTPIEKYTGGSSTYIVKDDVIYTDGGKTLYRYPTEKADENFVIPSEVTKLGYEAFFMTTKIKSVTIQDSVTSADYFAFCRSSLESIKFGKGLKVTSYQMFAGCPNLKDIDFGTGLQELFAQTFMECTGLTNVTLPENIKTIGVGAFAGCTNLTTFTSKSLKLIPFQGFYGCSKLTTVNLNEGITDISRSSFYGCYNLKSITLPKSVKYVHSIAFPSTTKITCKNTNMRKYGTNGYRYLQDVKITGTRKYSFAFEVLKLVNAERKKQGLSALKMDESLLETAMIRAGENSVLFSHTRPDGSICFDLSDKMIAENVAIGQKTAKEVMNAWMNSAGHKANILSKDATTIGIGCFLHNGVYYWAQNFGNGDNKSDCTKPNDKSKTQKIALATEKFTEAITQTGIVYSSVQEYSYKFSMSLNKSTIEKGKTTNAKIYVTNAGWQYAKALIDNSSFTWSSGYKKTVTVNSSGKITAKANGIATITAKLKHFKFTKKITVGKNSKAPGKMKLSSVKAIKGKKMTVKWKKDTSVSGYQIRYSTDKKFSAKNTKTVKINKNKTTSKDIKNLIKGKKYYVQIRAYRNVKVDGKNQKMYGSWSGTKNITAKK